MTKSSDMNLFSVLNSLFEGSQGDVEYKDFILEIWRESHPMQAVLPDFKCVLPVLVISKPPDKLIDNESPRASKHDTSASTQASYDGSPLKLQVFATDERITTTMSGKVIKPLSADEARSLMTELALCYERFLQQEKNPLPIWLLCDAEDSQHVACFGVHLLVNDVPNILNTLVTVAGPLKKPDLPKGHGLVKGHCWRTGKQSFECHCEAEYNVLDPATLGVTLDSIQGSLKVNVKWTGISNLLSHPPPDVMASVCVGVVAGSPDSNAYNFYQEFSTLKGIGKGLEDEVIQWSRANLTQPVLETVKMFINDIKKSWEGVGSENKMDDNADDNTDDNLFSKFALTKRKDLDFTEKLWNIIKDCSCMKELKECLHLVLSSLQKGDIQPMVHKNNKSRLAEIIRDSFFKKIVIPSLQDTLPIEILVDIGLEKLIRDYVYTLTGKELVTVTQLQWFIEREGSLLERLDHLERLHYVLEFVIALEQYSMLPTSVLSYAARHALKYYEQNAAADWHTFTIPVLSKNVVDITSVFPAKEWKAELVSEVNKVKVMSIHHLSSEPVMPHLNLQPTGVLMDSGDSPASRDGNPEWPYYYTAVCETLNKL